MNSRFRATGLTLAALAFVLQAGCHNQPTAPPSDSLVQTVRLEPAVPRKGETLDIISSIVNRGPRPRRVTHRICYLALGGDIELASTVRCAAVSTTTNLAPGQRVEMTDGRVVMSEAGVYTLTVNHLLDPDRTVTLTVRVGQ